MAIVLGLFFGTFISEDLACVTAALLIQRGEIDAIAALGACTAGIFVGDCALWATGRLGKPAARRWLSKNLQWERAERVRAWIDRDGATAIFISRFVPGLRLPIYFVAGLAGMPLGRFAAWTCAAVLLWTPFVILLASSTPVVVGPVAALGVLQGIRWIPSFQWKRTFARFARFKRWEFWPMWLFYAPVAVWVTLLAIRYRGISVITASNPGISDGGVVGESKFDILVRLPADCTIPSVVIESEKGATAFQRVQSVVDAMQRGRWTFPLILKPNVGQRGIGVRRVHDLEAVRDYFDREHDAVLAQPYHDGPFEAGVFYYRMPWWPHGRILSITDKHFPAVVGDGRSTLEELIWQHPRYRLQADVFLERHARSLHRVIESGERYQLAIAGNHAQGTVFRDGSRLLTPELERRIDEIGRAFPGFFVGRFDIRYRDEGAFVAGRDLAIVELNGATAESTDIYDPDNSLLSAYRQLFRQWAIVFAIGAANRASGTRVTSMPRLVALVRAYLAARVAHPVSD